MTTKQRKMAVRIAKDVIKQLDAETLVARHFGYTVIPGWYANNAADIDLRDHLRKLAKTKQVCSVCALGACFLADVRKRNNFPMGGEISRQVIGGRLGDIFGYDQLNLIECAYEGDTVFNGEGSYTPYEERWCAVKFGRKYTDSGKRLRAIMRNIIANNGEFLPTGIKKIRRELAKYGSGVTA